MPDTQKIVIDWTKPAPADARYVATFGARVQLGEMDCLKVYRSWQVNGEWRDADVAVIDGGTLFTIESGFLKKGNKGFWIDVQHVRIPRELAEQIVQAVIDALDARDTRTAKDADARPAAGRTGGGR